MTFSVDRTAVDRAGGIARLALIADSLVGKVWETSVFETPSSLRLVVYAYPEGTDVDDIDAGIAEGREEVELATVILSSSEAVRGDQRTLAADDRAELDHILEAEVTRRTYARLPELEKRAMEGDR